MQRMHVDNRNEQCCEITTFQIDVGVLGLQASEPRGRQAAQGPAARLSFKSAIISEKI